MPNGIISGSVIQRTFVGQDLLAPLFAASVPLNEVGAKQLLEDGIGFKHLVAEVLAVPSSALLDELQYRTLVDSVTKRPLGELVVALKSGVNREILEERRLKEPIRLFAEHSIALMMSNDPMVIPYWYEYPSRQEFIRKLQLTQEFYRKLQLGDTAFSMGFACLNARIRRPRPTSEFTNAVLDSDLPFGNSPRTSSDSLLKLLDSGKKMCLAPMVAAGGFGIGHLAQGQYVAAIMTVGAGSAMTLILLGSVAVGSLLVARVAQRRGGR